MVKTFAGGCLFPSTGRTISLDKELDIVLMLLQVYPGGDNIAFFDLPNYFAEHLAGNCRKESPHGAFADGAYR